MRAMTEDEWRSFLLDTPRTAKLATVRKDGRPHVAPIWFTLDGDELVFTTWHESVKAKAILRDPRVSLCIDDERPPFAFVMLDGTATIDEDPAELRTWAARIGGRYMGREQAEAYGERNGIPGELLVRVAITNVVAVDGVAE
jgi:PPOX class probable F420-dependent enzyme